MFNCNINNMEYGGYCSYEFGWEIKDLDFDFFKDNKFVYYFGVKFLIRLSYLFGKM